jgi:hypothetical protein
MANRQSETFDLLCKSLVLLPALPIDNQNNIFSLLSHTDILRLSACYHFLRKTIFNDNLFWKALYKDKFLSGAQYVEEYDFVLWCVRTNPKAPNKLLVRKMKMLENLDWYNIYCRRVIMENNWRNEHKCYLCRIGIR